VFRNMSEFLNKQSLLLYNVIDDFCLNVFEAQSEPRKHLKLLIQCTNNNLAILTV
jgi:hypothetical protein